MNGYDFEFIDTARTYEIHGIDSAAVREYYQLHTALQKYMYRVQVDDEIREYPLWVTEELLSPSDVDSLVHSFVDDLYTIDDPASLEREAVRMSYINNNAITEEIGEYVWNGELYRATNINWGDGEGFTVSFGETDYYSTLMHRERLRRELSQRLFQKNVIPRTPITKIQRAMQTPLVNRENCLSSKQDIFSVSGRPTKVGVSSLLAVEYENDVYIGVIERSDKTAEYPGMIGLSPAGILDKEDDKEPDLKKKLCEEFSEEWFGVTEDESSESDYFQSVVEGIEKGEVDLRHTGTSIDMMEGGLHIQTLLYIKEGELAEKLVESDTTGWEVLEKRFISLSDSELLKEVTQVGELLPVNAVGFFEGLRVLDEVYGESVSLEYHRSPVASYFDEGDISG